jgi:hypothetical protein
MTIEVLYVRPGADEVARGAVAVWDQDPAHFAVDAVWQTAYGGAHIVGNPLRPNAVYRVANTIGVQDAIRKGRLIVLDTLWEEPAAPVDLIATAPINRPAPGEVEGTGEAGADTLQLSGEPAALPSSRRRSRPAPDTNG